MKRVIALVLVFVCVFSLAACKGRTTTEDAKQDIAATETPAEQAAEEPAPTEKAFDYMSLYDIILTRYYDAISQSMTPEQLSNEGICYLAASYYGDEPLKGVGYTLKDITGDGIPELFIGGIGATELIELYTIYDEAVVSVFSAGERNAFYLCDNTMLANVGSGGAALTAFNYYVVDGKNLQFVEGILFDGMQDEANPWFKADSDDFFSGNDEKITEADARKVTDYYENMYTTLEFTPFAEYK